MAWAAVGHFKLDEGTAQKNPFGIVSIYRLVKINNNIYLYIYIFLLDIIDIG